MGSKKLIKITRTEKEFYINYIETIPIPNLDLYLSNPKLIAYNPFFLIKHLFYAKRKSELISILQKLLPKQKFIDCLNTEILNTLLFNKEYLSANERLNFIENFSSEILKLKIFLKQLENSSMEEKVCLDRKNLMKEFLINNFDYKIIYLLERQFILRKEKFILEKELPFIYTEEYLKKLSVLDCIYFNRVYPNEEIERRIVLNSEEYDFKKEKEIIVKNLENKKFIKELLLRRNIRRYLKFIPYWKELVDDEVVVTQRLSKDTYKFEFIIKALKLKSIKKKKSIYFTYTANKY